MTPWGKGIDRFAARGRLLRALVLAAMLIQVLAGPATAQMFSDQPPPVPPGSVPDPGGAISLAPPSGPGSVPTMPAPLTQPSLTQPSLTQPSIAALPPVAAPQGAAPPGQAVRPLTLKSETDREAFLLPAGGLRIEGRVGTSKIPQNQISFAIYKGSQFEVGERAPLVPSVSAGDVVLLPEGTYYIISNYGDANSVVRSDIRVQAGKLTDVIVTHRAAVITLKLVSDKGGEALANTAWSVITPGGDVIKESIGAFPRVVLSEGEYRAIAKNEGKVFERSFNVVNGVDGEVEVIAR